jgi:hypothetical protein
MGRVFLCATLTMVLFASAMLSIASADDYTKPTKQHKAMAEDVGVWDADVKIWMSPNAEPASSKAVEKNEMMGKLWLISKFDGEFGGEKFTGASAVSYDPIKKMYVGSWVDTMSPFMMTMEGKYDDGSKTLTMIGQGTDHMTGKRCTMKMVTKYASDEKKTFTMYSEREGGDKEWQNEKWQKTMVIEYTRRK